MVSEDGWKVVGSRAVKAGGPCTFHTVAVQYTKDKGFTFITGVCRARVDYHVVLICLFETRFAASHRQACHAVNYAVVLLHKQCDVADRVTDFMYRRV